MVAQASRPGRPGTQRFETRRGARRASRPSGRLVSEAGNQAAVLNLATACARPAATDFTWWEVAASSWAWAESCSVEAETSSAEADVCSLVADTWRMASVTWLVPVAMEVAASADSTALDAI